MQVEYSNISEVPLCVYTYGYKLRVHKVSANFEDHKS